MRDRICTALLLMLLIGATPAWAGPGSCRGVASDESGQSVRVTLAVGQGGEILSRDAFWEMRSLDADGPEGLSLEIGYVGATSETLGPPTSVSLNFLAIRTRPDLSGARGTLEISPAEKWTAPYQGFMGLGLVQLAVRTPWGGRLNTELIEAIESASRVSATLQSRDGRTIASAVLNPADHGSRDRLFREATASAERFARSPDPC